MKEVELYNLPYPDQLDLDWPDKAVLLIFEDDSEETVEIIKQFDKKNWQIVVVSLASIQNRFKVPAYQLTELSEDVFETILEDIMSKYGAIVGFIALAKSDMVQGAMSILDNQKEKKFVEGVFIWATKLSKVLRSEYENYRTFFITITSVDGNLGLNNIAGKGIISSGLMALAKTLYREWPEVFTRAIDFSPKLNKAEKVKLLLQEISDPDRSIVEVSYADNKRFTLVSMEI